MSLISPQNAQYLIEHLSDLSKGTDISRTSLARIENVIRAAGGMDSTVPSDPLQRPKYFFLPGLTAKPFWEPSQFEWVAGLEAQYETIKSELLQLRDNYSYAFGPHPQADLIRAGTWAEYHFFAGETRFQQNCARCPQTTRIIESIAEDKFFHLTYFSALAPGTFIRPHCGPSNLRLRCHLGLCVPDDCGMRVGTETRSWEEGKCVIFDDSFFHQAWNQSHRTRILLLIDFSHPDLTKVELGLLRKVLKIMDEMQDQVPKDQKRDQQLKKTATFGLPEKWWV